MTDTAQRTTIVASASDFAHADTISIDEIIERYRGEWILMRVTEDDEDGWATRGYLLEHAPTQKEILNAWERRAPEAWDGNEWPLYSFLAEPPITSGPEYNAAILEFFSGLLQAGTLRDADAER